MQTVRGDQKETIEDWWKNEVKKYSFCIMLFYRGRTSLAGEYLSSFMSYTKEVRAAGGEIFAVVPKYHKAMKLETMRSLNFRVINDKKNYLSTFYKITNSPSKKNQIMNIMKLKRNVTYFLWSQPGVAIISKPNSYLGQLVSTFTIKDKYDSLEVLKTSDVKDLVNLHFGSQYSTKNRWEAAQAQISLTPNLTRAD